MRIDSLLGWLCWRIVMAWPEPLPNCGENRLFAWCLARAGEYADSTPNAKSTSTDAEHSVD